MLVATFGPTTAWAGKTITYANERFLLQGHGVITATDVLSYDQQGHLLWAYDGLREWTQQVAVAAPQGVPQAAVRTAEERKSMPGWVIALICFAAVGIIVPVAIVGVKAVVDKVGDMVTVASGASTIRWDIEDWARSHNGVYPATIDEVRSSGRYTANWPTNPYTGRPMSEGRGPGDFTYAVSADGRSFNLVCYGEDGKALEVSP